MTNVDALQLVGPLGLLVAFMILSVIAACIGETVSHLVQDFSTPNAVFEYVYNFVDHELAWVVGFSYWYVSSSNTDMGMRPLYPVFATSYSLY